MLRNMSKVFNIINKLEPVFFSRNLHLARPGSLVAMYTFNDKFYFVNKHSERTLTTCRHCNYLLQNRFYDQPYSFSSNNLIGMNYSILRVGLGLCKKNLNIQELQKRQKSKRPQKRPEYESDSDQEEDSVDDGLSKATKPVSVRVQSLRIDGLLKKTLNIARNKVETAFYEGSIRVNGSKPNKKSYQAKEGDEIDLIKGVSPMNPDFLSISRVEIISVKEDPAEEEEKLIVKLRRTKTMYVENYETDPWKKSSSAE